jgi:hypothetical protein
MPELPNWLLVIVTAIIAPILVGWIQRRWKKPEIEAQVDRTEAETVVALTAAYDKLLSTTQDALEVAEAGIALRDEKIRNKDEEIDSLKEENALLLEQYGRAGAYLAAATAQIALYEGRALVNSEAEGEAGGNG